MRLEWIEDILSVAEMGSFNAAAEARFLTPSAFTRRIRAIEEALGCELFDRSKKPVELRRHVRENLPALRDAAASLRRARQLLSCPEVDQNQQVTLICQHALTASVVPELLTHPILGDGHKLRIKSGRKGDCLLALIRRDTDIALIYQDPGDEPQSAVEYCDQIALGTETFLPVIQSDLAHKLRNDPAPQRWPQVAYPASIFLGEVQRRTLASHSEQAAQLFTVAEAGLSLAVLEYVKRGIGLGWLPQAVVQAELEQGDLISLEDWLPHFELNILLLRLRNDLSELAEDFWAAMQQPDLRRAASG